MKLNNMRRFRPYREDAIVRDNNADVKIEAQNLIYPYFVVEGDKQKQEISTLPGVYRYSIDSLLEDLKSLESLQINKILLFGVVGNELKDENGTEAYNPDSLVCRALKAIRKQFPELIVFTDVCLCEYTSHGHCGLLKKDAIDNDTTLPLLAKTALAHARAGAHYVAPSAMMDGQVGAIRDALQQAGLDTKIMAYSAKYASGFYGPFRDAAASAPTFGDRKTYQMDFRNSTQSMLEIEADLEEGASIVMVKPAQLYLDVITNARQKFPKAIIAAYQVSGEYSLLKFGAKQGIIDEEKGFIEALTAIRRAGADLIITYYAKEYIKRSLQ